MADKTKQGQDEQVEETKVKMTLEDGAKAGGSTDEKLAEGLAEIKAKDEAQPAATPEPEDLSALSTKILRQRVKHAGIPRHTKMLREELIEVLSGKKAVAPTTDEAADAKATKKTKAGKKAKGKATKKKTAAKPESVEFAVWPKCPKCGNELDEDMFDEEGAGKCVKCETKVVRGTHSACETDIIGLHDPVPGDKCPKCKKALVPKGSDETKTAGSGTADDKIKVYRDEGKIVYSDPRNEIFFSTPEDEIRTIAKKFDEKKRGDDYIPDDVLGVQLICQGTKCGDMRKSYSPRASNLLDMLEKVEKGEHFQAISPWHPGHKDCREEMLGTDTPCPLCGNMLHAREERMLQAGKFATCKPCQMAAEEAKVTVKSDKSNEEVTLPLIAYLTGKWYQNPILTYKELEAAKKAGEIQFSEHIDELPAEVIDLAKKTIAEWRVQNQITPIKCQRCKEGYLRKWQVDKKAAGERVCCDKCGDELYGDGSKEAVPCGHPGGCTNTVMMDGRMRYLVGDKDVRCWEHKETPDKDKTEAKAAVPETPDEDKVEAKTAVPETVTETETTDETPEAPAETGTTPPPAPPVAPQITPIAPAPVAAAPVSPTGEGTAATIAALGQYTGGLGTLVQALRPEPIDLSGFMNGAAGIARETAAAGAKGNEALARVAEKQADKMGEMGKTAQDGLNRVLDRMLSERQAPTAEQIADTTYRRIFSEVDPDGRRIIPAGGRQQTDEDQADQPVGPPPTEAIPRS